MAARPVNLSPTHRKYTATVENVREVGLRGRADLVVWAERLERDGVVPYRGPDGAELMVMACGTRFRGIPFRECSIAVAVSHAPDGASHDAWFLTRAFNSQRLFAWVERTVFKTPYRHADVQVEGEGIPRFHVRAGDTLLVEAARAGALDEGGESDVTEEVTIHLPARGSKPGGVYHAVLRGPTRVVPFAAHDTFVVRSSDDEPALALLEASAFRGREWHVRLGAVHARTKTYKRDTPAT